MALRDSLDPALSSSLSSSEAIANVASFWSACLAQLERELPAQQFNTWIKGLRLEASGSPDQLNLLAPNRFVLQWVRERYLSQIQELSQQFYPMPVSINLGLAGNTDIESEAEINDDAIVVVDAPAPATLAPAIISGRDDAYDKTRLNPTFTFDTLVTGRANDLARAAAQQVALNPGISYNPLFVYGGVGLGKTHLIHAIGNSVYQANPGAVIRYIHAEDFVSDVVRAYQQKAFDVFKRYYRSLDLLLIDDIQFFVKKDRTQEEFFYAFNALAEAKKQIIITCDTYPKDIDGLEERLISRFDWGLTVQIEPPETEMRVAILKKKAEASRIDLGDDVAFLIAKHLRSNVRELEGALNRVVAYARFHNRVINIDVAKDALKDIIGATNRQISLELIQKTVADYYKIKVADMYSQKRTRAIARPRQIAMWICRELTAHSLPEIGEAFGGRDHTTVLHACRTVVDLRSKDSHLNNDLHVLEQTIKG
ncbi:MAG: chromosomal replication initiator protein DnaA [Rhodocyclaceae bacterium]|nr:chromosomal replication initiator protein DnaA [Rhodocyclaceae bacterium]